MAKRRLVVVTFVIEHGELPVDAQAGEMVRSALCVGLEKTNFDVKHGMRVVTHKEILTCDKEGFNCG